MDRVFNFSAGPSTLPVSVLSQASQEMLNYRGTGMSVMEMSHRSKMFIDIIETAEKNLRDILDIPSNYKVLFLHGGATLQFSMVPLNLLRKSKKADYINTGEWSKKAIKEARKFGDIKIVASSEAETFNHIPEFDDSMVREDADYVYYVSNNTIYGTEFLEVPNVGEHVLVSDMSSDILSRPVDVAKFGLIYAGAQKNMGIAGLTVVIIRDDLIGFADSSVPQMLDYKVHADNESMLNTPATYNIYIAGLMFEWIKKMGGLKVMQELNEKKAALIYDYLDKSDFFKATIAKPEHRSRMNVNFRTPSAEFDKAFVAFTETRGMGNLKGYRTVGGIRASIYNAMPIEGVETLVKAMADFEELTRTNQ